MVNGIRQAGQLVRSTAGRDRNRYFLIFDVLNQSFVRVVDGDLRRVEAPKKKNVLHLLACPQVAEELALKLSEGRRVTNEEVRKALEKLGAAPES